METEWLKLEEKKYNIAGGKNLNGGGGGVAKINGKIVGVDKNGKFFTYEYGGEIEKLNIDINMNYGKLIKYIEERKMAESAKIWFRVLDIYTEGKKIYILHHYWKEKKRVKW